MERSILLPPWNQQKTFWLQVVRKFNIVLTCGNLGKFDMPINFTITPIVSMQQRIIKNITRLDLKIN